MKIVNADWEIKNIGKVTLEITLDKSDLNVMIYNVIDTVLEAKKNYQAEYVVLKIPTGNPVIGIEFSQHGFFHIETQLNLKATRDDVESALKKYSDLFCDAKIEHIDNLKELSNIQNEVRKGIFSKDRISLDPYFNEEIANKRYSNWIEDEFKKCSQLSYIVVDRKKIGFSLWRYDKFSAVSVLAGLFHEYQFSNLGGRIYFASMREALSKGTKKFYTSVSSNNPSSLHLHELFGFKVSSMQEVYVSHS